MADSSEPRAEVTGSGGFLVGETPRSEKTRVGLVSALVASTALVTVAIETGDFAVVQGVVSASLVLTAWYLLAPTYAFALGHVALVALLPEGGVIPETALIPVIAVEVGLLGVLLASVTTLGQSSESALGQSSESTLGKSSESSKSADSSRLTVSCLLLTLGWVFSSVALAWATARSLLSPSLAGGLLVSATGLTAYGLYRYQLVALGVVGENHE